MNHAVMLISFHSACYGRADKQHINGDEKESCQNDVCCCYRLHLLLASITRFCHDQEILSSAGWKLVTRQGKGIVRFFSVIIMIYN